MAEGPDEMRIRRVGFRHGTDAELAAMHVVESEIESERHPGSPPQPLASYMAFARSLPSQFDDHTWVAEEDDGTPAGCAACWSNAAGDARVMESYVYVRRPWRRHGIGRRLVRAITEEVLSEARSLLIWTTYDSAPAGDAFSRCLNGAVGRVSRNSELSLGDVDWGRVQSWVDDGPRRAPGYALQFWEGPLPAHVRDDAAHFHHLMNLQPHDDLAIGDVVLDATDVEELDGNLAESGRQLWTLFVRDPEGRCVGGTELTFEPWEPHTALQRNTATDPDHRGIGLAKWAKAGMLLRLRSERPAVTLVRTGNAFSNDAMLAINTALGFKVVEIRTEWQAAVRDLDATLRRMNA